MKANQLINTLVANDKNSANEVFSSLIQDKLMDALEVAKVEVASTLMGNEEVVEENTITEGEGMDAQRRWVRHVSAIGKGYEGSLGRKVSVHRDELKQAARKYFQSRQPHGAQFTDQGAAFVRDARKAVKRKAVKEETLEEGGPTRKHFQQVADLLKNIPDEAKRKELAQHHASLFKSQNPRFDHKRFYAAAGVNEALEPGSAPTNAQLNRNVLTNIRRATQTLRLAGVNPTIAAAGHRDFGKLVAKNPKAPGYMLMRKLAPNKAMAVQAMTSAGVPLGQSLEANPADFNQVLQRIKRFK